LPPSFRKNEPKAEAPAPPPSPVGRKIGFAIAIAIPIILVGVGLWLVITVPKRSAKVQGVIASVDCEENNCTTVVEYTPVNGKPIKLTLNGVSKFAKGETVTVRYDPSDPTNYSINEISLRTWGMIIIIAAVIIFAITFLVWWILRRFKNNNAEIGSDVV
jgi:hypothetical protein